MNQSQEEVPRSESMFLVLPVPLRRRSDALLFERQACNGLDQWAQNFDPVVVAAPVMPDHLAERDRTITWDDTAPLRMRRVRFVELPWAYGWAEFGRTLVSTLSTLKREISCAKYLQFAIGGLIGDWAALGAMLALRKGRRFAIHTDRVEPRVLLEVTRNASVLRRIEAKVISPLMWAYHRHLIRHCALGLWHGRDCYDAYAPFCDHSFIIHDVHTKPADLIEDSCLAAKLIAVGTDDYVRVCYAGRLDPMKAPLDWLKAIAVARDRGARVRAVWFGEGSLRRDVESEIATLDLQDVVSFPGFLEDRSRLLGALRASHLMLFTHVTPESPRCLLESLISGTPIVGYENAFAADLTENLGGGEFVSIRDWRALGQKLAELSRDRNRLGRLIQEAAKNGKRFTDAAVFQHRSELIKAYC